MRKTPGARYVVFRTHEQTHNGTMTGHMKRVGVIHGRHVHTISGTPGFPITQRKGRLLDTVEIIRDATPREVSLGLVIH